MPKPAGKRKAAWEEMMKQSIFEATVSVMKEHGPAGIRMDLVATAAEIATGTLYNYFKDKDSLLLHVIDTLFNPYHEQLDAILKSNMDPKDKLEAYFGLSWRTFSEQRDLIAILTQAKDLGLKQGSGKDPEEHYRVTVIKIIREIIEEGINKGVFRRCHTFEAAAMVFASVDGVMELKLRGLAPERAVEEDVQDCMAFILPGILAPA